MKESLVLVALLFNILSVVFLIMAIRNMERSKKYLSKAIQARMGNESTDATFGTTKK